MSVPKKLLRTEVREYFTNHPQILENVSVVEVGFPNLLTIKIERQWKKMLKLFNCMHAL